MKKIISLTFILLFGFAVKKTHGCMYCSGGTILYSVGLEISENKFNFITVRWMFDERFSGMLLWKYDRNGDKKITGKEIYYLKKYGFNILKRYNYYTYITFRGKKITGFKVTHFEPIVNNGHVVYFFKVPVDIDIKKNIELKIEFKSPGHFILFKPDIYGNTPGKVEGNKVKRVFTNKSVNFLIFKK